MYYIFSINSSSHEGLQEEKCILSKMLEFDGWWKTTKRAKPRLTDRNRKSQNFFSHKSITYLKGMRWLFKAMPSSNKIDGVA